MKNSLNTILIFLIANFFVIPDIKSQEIFNFNVTNIEISEKDHQTYINLKMNFRQTQILDIEIPVGTIKVLLS